MGLLATIFCENGLHKSREVEMGLLFLATIFCGLIVFAINFFNRSLAPGMITSKILKNMDFCLKCDFANRTLTYSKVQVTMGPYQNSCIVLYKDKEGRWVSVDDEFLFGDHALIYKKAEIEMDFQRKKYIAKKKDDINSALS